MNITVDLDEVYDFVTSKEFMNFLTSNTTDISISVFILQELMNRIKWYKEHENGEID